MFRQWEFAPTEGNKVMKGLVIGAMVSGAMGDVRADVRAVKNAPCDRVKRVFREKARLHHPDKGGSAADFRRLVLEKNASVKNCARRAEPVQTVRPTQNVPPKPPPRRRQKNNRGKKNKRKKHKKKGRTPRSKEKSPPKQKTAHNEEQSEKHSYITPVPIVALALGGAAIARRIGSTSKRKRGIRSKSRGRVK